MNSVIDEAARNHMTEQFYSSKEDEWNYPCDIDDIQKQCVNDFKDGIEWLREYLVGEENTQNEYMRGDLIELDNELKIVLVSGSSNLIVSELSNKREATLCDVSEVKSISLTPQILENNGWKLHCDPCIGYKGLFSDQIIAVKGRVCLFYPKDNPKKFTFRGYDGYGAACGAYNDIEYVHQLQHLLFGLRMDSKIKI